MSLPTRVLDDRTFQDIVDEAKKRIAASCPEWTDHNVSDPGVTLVELFAWMTEMVLYRLNQVPEKNYIKLMDLLGIHLREAEPARVGVTSYLTAPQSNALSIPEGTEVATVRAEGRPSIAFSADDDLTINPADLTSLLTQSSRGDEDRARFRVHNLKQLGATGFRFQAFGEPPKPDDALYFGFAQDLSHHVLGLEVSCETATGMGIDTTNPPWAWEGWAGDEQRWIPAVVELDATGGMNQPGMIRLRLPQLAVRELGEREGFWVRCRLIESEARGTNYERSPVLMNAAAGSWGITGWATHASFVRGERIGRSDGSPGQVFKLEHAPVLRRRQGETVEVPTDRDQAGEEWTEVDDFAESSGSDRHFTLDSITGEIRFGPALRQPDGSVRSYGAIPLRGAELSFSAYRHGGGVVGNILKDTLTVLKTSIPYIERVTNHENATGGLDAETIELAQLRAPQTLRTRGRAVTSADYELLARMADPRVHRARCLQPRPDAAGEGPTAGQVYLLLVPYVQAMEAAIPREQLVISDELRRSVAAALDQYRLLTVRLNIQEPEYTLAGVEITISAAAEADRDRVRKEADKRLYRFLNPIEGGPDGGGWPFGRDLFPSDIYACLAGLSGVEFIEEMKLFQVLADGKRKEVTGRLPILEHGLIASSQHKVIVN